MPPWFKRFDLRQCCGSSGSFFTPMDCFVIETDACILPEWFVRILRFGPRSLMFLSVWLRVKVNASICVWVLGRKCVWVFLYVCLWANKGVGVCVCFGECVIVFCVLGCVCVVEYVSQHQLPKISRKSGENVSKRNQFISSSQLNDLL